MTWYAAGSLIESYRGYNITVKTEGMLNGDWSNGATLRTGLSDASWPNVAAARTEIDTYLGTDQNALAYQNAAYDLEREQIQLGIKTGYLSSTTPVYANPDTQKALLDSTNAEIRQFNTNINTLKEMNLGGISTPLTDANAGTHDDLEESGAYQETTKNEGAWYIVWLPILLLIAVLAYIASGRRG